MHVINGRRVDRDRVDMHRVNRYLINENICRGVVCVRAGDNRSRVTGLDVKGFDWFGVHRRTTLARCADGVDDNCICSSGVCGYRTDGVGVNRYRTS